METTLKQRLALPLPRRMRTLRKDARGYPIPFLVLIDEHKQPQFTINDVRRAILCRQRGLCAICGKRFAMHRLMAHPGAIFPEMWFVGGSRCFLHARGAFLDPPMHFECAEYALRVCPFLAAPSYSGRIDDAKLAVDGLPRGMTLQRSEFVGPARPVLFGLGLTYDYRFIASGGVYLVDDWRYVEWWDRGERVNAPASGVSPPVEELA